MALHNFSGKMPDHQQEKLNSVKKEHIMIEWLTDSCLMPTLGTCQGYKSLDLD